MPQIEKMPPPGPPPDAKPIKVITASIEVKTLTVDGMRVSYDFYDQLHEEPLFDRFSWDAGGTPWGRVNYHSGRCSGDSEHEHVIWQKGDQLRRARVDKPGDDVPCLGYEDSTALCVVVGGVPEARIDREDLDRLQVSIKIEDGTSMTATLNIEDSGLGWSIRHRHLGGPWNGWQPHEPELDRLHAELHPRGAACAAARAALEDCAQRDANWRIHSAAQWQQILTLDQLYLIL